MLVPLIAAVFLAGFAGPLMFAILHSIVGISELLTVRAAVPR